MTGVTADDAQREQDLRTALLARISEVEAPRRFLRTLGAHHHAAFAQGSETLVVTFEDSAAVAAEEDALPLAHTLREAFGWSALSLLADRRDWFRAQAVYDFFDEMTEKGLFDAFDRVLFYGAGTSGHAACAYSVSAPGATVIAIAPQATLSAQRAAFDSRFRTARRLDFTSRYGYAPDMLDAAEGAHIFFDPAIWTDAAHAAQFNRAHIRLHRLFHFGETPETILVEGGMLGAIFRLFEEDKLTPARISRALRARRQTRSYLLRLTQVLAARKHDYLNAVMCNNVAVRMNAPRFRKRADQIAAALNEKGISLPFQDDQVIPPPAASAAAKG
ncbi:phosphoadenosine phosphosulfate reductase [Anianabacter salinae]|uniref:phosphoadenosine phosphosulfate reductase n=1 Tax=Anianabacter salinae TaxID=2851023 RepID=UPI00225DFE54|nr:phosphoadenosine phosphosulfate reductase [Anianabacter salinae]MBV0911494.1 phosphoadenosine phosphosulfate reductase [Anianabacter salinae]